MSVTLQHDKFMHIQELDKVHDLQWGLESNSTNKLYFFQSVTKKTR